jgi:hypothetical protein
VERWHAEQRVRRLRAETGVELLEPRQHPAHAEDGVASFIGAAAVRRAAARLDSDPLKTFVRHGDVEVGRLGDHRAVRAKAADQGVGA